MNRGWLNPLKATDILSNEEIKIKNNILKLEVLCGMFRFIDIELDQVL